MLRQPSERPNTGGADARKGRKAVGLAQARDTIAYVRPSRRVAVLNRTRASTSVAPLDAPSQREATTWLARASAYSGSGAKSIPLGQAIVPIC